MEGAGYAESARIAQEATGGGFDENLRTLRRQARYAPWDATPVVDEIHRVSQVFDYPSGYSLALYFTWLRNKWACRLEWLAAVPLEPEFDPWD